MLNSNKIFYYGDDVALPPNASLKISPIPDTNLMLFMKKNCPPAKSLAKTSSPQICAVLE